MLNGDASGLLRYLRVRIMLCNQEVCHLTCMGANTLWSVLYCCQTLKNQLDCTTEDTREILLWQCTPKYYTVLSPFKENRTFAPSLAPTYLKSRKAQGSLLHSMDASD